MEKSPEDRWTYFELCDGRSVVDSFPEQRHRRGERIPMQRRDGTAVRVWNVLVVWLARTVVISQVHWNGTEKNGKVCRLLIRYTYMAGTGCNN